MAQEDYQEGYISPEGGFYRSPEEEIKHHHGALESSRNEYKGYEKAWKWIGKPGFLYSGLRLFGLSAGIGPEIDAMDPEILDVIGGTLVYAGSICKFCSFLTSFDVKSAKRDLGKAVKRLGFNNSAIETIVAENSQ